PVAGRGRPHPQDRGVARRVDLEGADVVERDGDGSTRGAWGLGGDGHVGSTQDTAFPGHRATPCWLVLALARLRTSAVEPRPGPHRSGPVRAERRRPARCSASAWYAADSRRDRPYPSRSPRPQPSWAPG